MISYILYSILAALLGAQISLDDLKLYSGNYNYKITIYQNISLFCFIFFSFALILDSICQGIGYTILGTLLILILAIFKEWFASKINTSKLYFSIIYQTIIIGAVAFYLFNNYVIFMSLPFVWGIYFRNCPFGVIHGKPFMVSTWLSIKSNTNYDLNTKIVNKEGYDSIQNHYDVTNYGILPNSKMDLTHKTQCLIDEVGENGGGTIFFPKGRYLYNGFLQINYSNINIVGEVDDNGKPLAELVICKNTVNGMKNPWLSPFFITTGERLQRSNIFWGLQFRKKRNVITRSGSLADPGSDGQILTPEFATKVLKNSYTGERFLHVEDSTKIGKYILLGLYNTTKDGNLIKDILGVASIREEWGTARRAGEEEAPSYQWLVEVSQKIDKHTLKLSNPLLRDCEMKYTPEIYNVEMLENIEIRNIRLNTKWNGLFRHHGFPLYYSIRQSQIMDYGWNGINMKRVAHGKIENVVIENFSNPLYVMDSRNIVSRNIVIKGYDGHQGIKVYEHACNNTFEDIVFYNHYADMLGGEGNAYGNKFSNIRYLNPNFKPVDFDFHGFSEGPMSPPAHNLFVNIRGFRYIKTAGALYNMPGCAQYNRWKNIVSEGEKKGAPLFISLPYIPKKGIFKNISAIRHSLVRAMQSRIFSFNFLRKMYKERIKEMGKQTLPVSQHWILYKNCILEDYITTSTYPKDKC